MDKEEAKKRIMEFMGENILTVISTIDMDGNKPESAVIAFAQTENFELIFGTLAISRKYKNLQKNPNVSFVIGWNAETGTVQYEGTAKELSDEESPAYAQILANKNPRAGRYITKKSPRLFLVKPTWIRILDMIKNPDETFEITF